MLRERPRPSTRANAAKHAAAPVVWPLGNDGPSVCAIGLAVGRMRSTSSLIWVLINVCPTQTAIRNTGSHRLGRRIISTTNTPTAKPTITPVLPKEVTKSSMELASEVMCCSPQGAIDRSTRSRSEFVRTSRASPPNTTPPTMRMIRPRVSRRPVSVLGSRRANARCRRVCRSSSCATTFELRADAGSIPGWRRTASANSAPSSSAGPSSTSVTSRVASWTHV